MVRITQIGVVEPERAAGGVVGDLNETTKVGSDASRVKQARLLWKQHLVVLRQTIRQRDVGQGSFGTRVRSLEHQRQRRNIVEQQRFLVLRGNSFDLLHVIQHVAVQFEATTERRELGKCGVACLARESGLPAKAGNGRSIRGHQQRAHRDEACNECQPRPHSVVA